MKKNEQPLEDQDIKHTEHTNEHLMGVTRIEERKTKKIIEEMGRNCFWEIMTENVPTLKILIYINRCKMLNKLQ